MKQLLVSATMLGILVGVSSSAYAQVFRIGGAVVMASDDASARLKNSESAPPVSAIRLPIHAVVYVAPRIGFGAEWMTLGHLFASVANTASFSVTDDEKESLLVGTLHARLMTAPRFTLEAVGGAGALRLERTTRTTFRFPDGSGVVTDQSKHPVFMAGLDAPIRLDRHFSAGPTVRVYWIRREKVATSVISSGPSTRLMAGVSASVTW